MSWAVWSLAGGKFVPFQQLNILLRKENLDSVLRKGTSCKVKVMRLRLWCSSTGAFFLENRSSCEQEVREMGEEGNGLVRHFLVEK